MVWMVWAGAYLFHQRNLVVQGVMTGLFAALLLLIYSLNQPFTAPFPSASSRSCTRSRSSTPSTSRRPAPEDCGVGAGDHGPVGAVSQTTVTPPPGRSSRACHGTGSPISGMDAEVATPAVSGTWT